jgi:hypothetical protein
MEIDLLHIQDVANTALRSLPKEHQRCHESAIKCAELLRKEGYKVVVKHGSAAYCISFLADAIAKTGNEFDMEISKILRRSSVPGYYVSHSLCEVEDEVIVDILPNIHLRNLQCSGPTMINRKNDLDNSKVLYFSCGREFLFGKFHFLIVPNLLWWGSIVPFRLEIFVSLRTKSRSGQIKSVMPF